MMRVGLAEVRKLIVITAISRYARRVSLKIGTPIFVGLRAATQTISSIPSWTWRLSAEVGMSCSRSSFFDTRWFTHESDGNERASIIFVKFIYVGPPVVQQEKRLLQNH